jgi:hypothetical protein
VDPEFFKMVVRVRIIPNPQGWGEGTMARVPVPELTDQGNALAVEMGLLTARLLLRDYGDILHWKLVTSPKNDISVHLPVVMAPDKTAFEPVVRAHATAIAVLEGRLRGDEAWVNQFRYMENAALKA